MSDQQAQELTVEVVPASEMQVGDRFLFQGLVRTVRLPVERYGATGHIIACDAGAPCIVGGAQLVPRVLAARAPVQVERPDEGRVWKVVELENGRLQSLPEDGSPPPTHRRLIDVVEDTTWFHGRAARLPERPDEGITDAMVEAAMKPILREVVRPNPATTWNETVREALTVALAARPVSSEESP